MNKLFFLPNSVKESFVSWQVKYVLWRMLL